jgi:hypothetical protein
LKKQSQFAGGQIGVSPYLKGDYDKNRSVGQDKNKPNQSQLNWIAVFTGMTVWNGSITQKGIERRSMKDAIRTTQYAI